MGTTTSITGPGGIPLWSESKGTNSFYNPKTGKMEPCVKKSLFGLSTWFEKPKQKTNRPTNRPNRPTNRPNRPTNRPNRPPNVVMVGGVKQKVQRCKGKTLQRTRCLRKTTSKSGFCKYHMHRKSSGK